jgi:cell division protein ZapA
MGEKVKTVVRISGNEYTLSADASEEYIHKVALYVDRKMNQIRHSRTDLSTAMIAVLAAVNITSELFAALGDPEGSSMNLEQSKSGASSLPNNVSSFKDIKKG